MHDTITDRLDADIAAVGRPPATVAQIAETLGAIGTAFGAAAAQIPTGETCAECGGPAGYEHMDGTWRCGHHAMRALFPPAIPRIDRVQHARDHIRTAIRYARAEETSIQCQRGAVDDPDWDTPNAATDIIAELVLALEGLKGMDS